MLDAIDTISVIGVPNDRGVRTSILVRFVTIRDCQRVEDFLRSDEFRESPHAGTSWHHDSSELLRVGRTRMIAVGDALAAAYPGIELRATFVRYPAESGMKHLAQEFANSHIVIDNTPFHIDAAIAANPDYVPNPAARIILGGRTFSGCRLKNRGAGRGNRGRGRGRGRGGHQEGHIASLGNFRHPTNVISADTRGNAGVNAPQRSAATSAPTAATQSSSSAAPPPGPSKAPPTKTPNLTNQLPVLNGPSAYNVELFAHAGNYGSSRVSNRVGGFPDRYASVSQARFSPYDVRLT
jgi:hypothetical protein